MAFFGVFSDRECGCKLAEKYDAMQEEKCKKGEGEARGGDSYVETLAMARGTDALHHAGYLITPLSVHLLSSSISSPQHLLHLRD